MKRSIIYFLVVAVLAGSCVKLKEVPEGSLSPENFYKTQADFEAAVTGVYAPLYTSYQLFDADPTMLLGGGADDAGFVLWDPEYAGYETLKVLPGFTTLFAVWSQFYSSINNANTLIRNLPNAQDVSQEKLDEFEGQARFLRALSYFYVTRYWGKVPLITELNNDKPEEIAESPETDIYKLIIDDLKVAEQKLSTAYPEKGKATKGAAKALLAKVYLTMAGWPVKDASYYPLARDKAKEVMDMNMYELMPDFADQWLVANKLTSKESIFTFFGSSKYSWAEGSHQHVGIRPAVEGGWSSDYTELDFFNKFPEGSRKDATFHTIFNDGSSWRDDVNQVPYFAKFRDAGAAAGQNTDVFSFDGDGASVLIRYADVLLIYAEAANMAEGTPSEQARDAINKVRVRAGIDPLPAGMAKEAFDKAVFDERGWEFTFEFGSRWFDLIRKEKLLEVKKPQYPYIDEHNMLLPKPSKELDLIKGLHQNDGY
ncbi:MAG: RagB/SusD family nutrient uptake outer membrane protein [Agriterribacter sp.]